MGLIYVANTHQVTEGFRFSSVAPAKETNFSDRSTVLKDVKRLLSSFDVFKLSKKLKANLSDESDDHEELTSIRVGISSGISGTKKDSELLLALCLILTNINGYSLRYEESSFVNTALEQVSRLLKFVSDSVALDVLEKIKCIPSSADFIAFFALYGNTSLRTEIISSLSKFSPRNAAILFQIASGLKTISQTNPEEVEADYTKILNFRIDNPRFGIALDF